MLPEALSSLQALATNLWWSWDSEATELWRTIDPSRWERVHHNPVAMLRDVNAPRWDELAEDVAFVRRLEQVAGRFNTYLHDDRTWLHQAHPELTDKRVVYISMEFGLHESIRLYSGGLGVLAGDHIRSASDLGIPLVGVSFLWRHGYFRQLIDDGEQIAAYPDARLNRLPIAAVPGPDGEQLEIQVPVADRLVHARVWVMQVGRCPLYLIDALHPDNHPVDEGLSDKLYGGDTYTRIRQEMVLGVGAHQIMVALGEDVNVYHLNEGHCAFVALPLLASAIKQGHKGQAALDVVRQQCVFTTHTPVPAGHDRFEGSMVHHVIGPYLDANGLDHRQAFALGRVNERDHGESYCMTVLAMKAAASTNGVSRLHGHVSRQMWHELWPDLSPDDAPIGHVTNGVHHVFWTSKPFRQLYDRHLPAWRERPWDPAVWAAIDQVPDDALWAARTHARRQLIATIERECGKKFDPQALTVCFARRFAPYKRATLLFRDPERLKALLDHRSRVQLVFAGKAHPRDTAGRELVEQVVRWADHVYLRDRIAFVENYDIELGRILTAGADVWLNNPRRPHEASGTSGQKSVLNGGINLSVLDGWWDEGFNGDNGWAIGGGQLHQDRDQGDAEDAHFLLSALEQQVLPTWSSRVTGTPERWLQTVRASIRSCAPLFTSHRMVRDYTRHLYAPLCIDPVAALPVVRVPDDGNPG